MTHTTNRIPAGPWHEDPMRPVNGNIRIMAEQCTPVAIVPEHLPGVAKAITALPTLHAACQAADTAFACLQINLNHVPQARGAVREAWPLIQQALAAIKPEGEYAKAIEEAQQHEIKRLDGIIWELIKVLQIIKVQSLGDDWTPERACDFIKQLSHSALVEAATKGFDYHDLARAQERKKDDGTCTGDAAKCCGNCGDRPPGWTPEPPAPYTGDMDPECYYAKSCGNDIGTCPTCKERRQVVGGIYHGDGNVPGDHSECGPDCCITGDRCDGSQVEEEQA